MAYVKCFGKDRHNELLLPKTKKSFTMRLYHVTMSFFKSEVRLLSEWTLQPHIEWLFMFKRCLWKQ